MYTVNQYIEQHDTGQDFLYGRPVVLAAAGWTLHVKVISKASLASTYGDFMADLRDSDE